MQRRQDFQFILLSDAIFSSVRRKRYDRLLVSD